MNIAQINNYNLNMQNCLAFKSNSKNKKQDINSYAFNSKPLIEFKPPVTPAEAYFILSKTRNKKLEEICNSAKRTRVGLYETATNLFVDKNLENIQIKKLLGVGYSAFAFETTEGNVLKVTQTEHFPKGRKPDFFDLPIIKKGKMGDTYYYLEEKVSQDDLKEKDIIPLIKTIQSKGYKIDDFLVFGTKSKNIFGQAVNKYQFGRTKDGHVYLIDPGCVQKKSKMSFVKKIWKKIH